MSNDKKAFVFDTNFIIQITKLDEVVENLKDTYTVYVTQVSIDERIAQQCRDLKADFDEIEKCKKRFMRFASIKLKKTYDAERSFLQVGIQDRYKNTFGDCIIPFSKDENTFSAILNRANEKLPPFLNVKDASDKGFKDCLLWLSILDYFKNNGENEIVFLTDDKSAFRNHTDYLTKEFKDVTGKSIEFKPNSFYGELIKSEKDLEENKKTPLPDTAQFRDKLNDVVRNLCTVEVVDGWGRYDMEKTFTLNQQVDGNYMKVIFNGLHNDIESNMFKQYIYAESVFNLDDRLKNTPFPINIKLLEDAYRLHEEAKDKFPDFLDQFYAAAADIFNENYIDPTNEIDDDDLPF